MDCPSCQHENPEDAQFCGECGSSLARMVRCEGCGRENPASQKFCNGCGAKAAVASEAPDADVPERSPRDYTPAHLADRILLSRSALEGERKRVTVMFADLRGSMELSEQLDPEAWHRVLERFFEILGEGVHRFEGTINQYTGDGIMALFGAPIAHEDHAQRACWSALWLREPLRAWTDELRRTRGLSLSIRMGVHSGEVVVGRIGDDLRMDYTAQGHTVGLAQRMEQLAEPGTAYITAETARQVEGYFALRDLGEFTVKGVQGPVGVFELEGQGELRTRLDVSRARGFSRFVGRNRELGQLKTTLDDMLEGRDRIAGIVGDAGVGKSRLCLEFIDHCRGREIPVWQAHCPPHGRSVPMLPITELTRDFFGVRDLDDPAEARRRIAGTLILLDESFRDDLPLAFELAHFSDPEHPVPQMDPETHRIRVLDLIKRMLEARGANEPAVLLFDDLHWIDEQSDAFLAQMLETLGTTRTLCLLNYRPEYEAPWMKRSNFQRIPLHPLGREDCDALLRDLLGSAPSLDDLRVRIASRSGGNPFYAEELAVAYADAGAFEGERGSYRLVRDPKDVVLPDSVHGLLAARVDRLGENEKQALQAAAVIGREFSEAVLEPVVNLEDGVLATVLDALCRSELIHPTSLYPVAEYAFKHPLTHEVALTSQLAERRARTHAAAAHAIEALTPVSQHDEHAALLAHHWEEGGHPLAAAKWHRCAAMSVHNSDASAAMMHWQRAASLAASPPETDESRLLRLEACREIVFSSWRVGLKNEVWQTVLEEGVELARQLGDWVTHATLLSGAAGRRGFAGEHRAQIEMLEEAFALAEEKGDFALQASLYQRVGWAWAYSGDYRSGLEWTKRGIAFSERDPERAGAISGFETYPWLVAQSGFHLAHDGRFDEADRALMRADRLLERSDDDFTKGYVMCSRSIVSWYRGDMRESRLRAGVYLDFAGRAGSALTQHMALQLLGDAASGEGDWPGAAENFEEALEGVRESTEGAVLETVHALIYIGLALVAIAAGDTARARLALRDAEDLIARKPELEGSDPRIDLGRIEAWLSLDGVEARARVEARLEVLFEQAYERGCRSVLPLALVQRARLHHMLGEDRAARADLEEARGLFVSSGATGYLERLDRLIAT